MPVQEPHDYEPAFAMLLAPIEQPTFPRDVGVNGGVTVLGSILAIIRAIAMNFTVVLLSAALGYLIALLLLAGVLTRAAGEGAV